MLDILPSETTPNFAFAKHDEVVIDGIAFRPVDRTASGHVFVRTDAGGVAQGFSHTELGYLAQVGKITHNRGAFMPEAARRRVAVPAQLLCTLPPEKHRKAKVDESIVLAFLQLEREGRVKRTDASIKGVLPELKLAAAEYLAVPSEWDEHQFDRNTLRIPAKVSPRTVRRRLSAYEAFGLAGLFGRESRRGNRQSRLGPEELALMAPVINGYMDERRPSIAAIHENVRACFGEENLRRAGKGLTSLTCPTYETVRMAVKNLDPFHVAVARDGLEAARRKFAPVGKGLELTRPLQRVEMDEWKVDLVSIMSATGLLHHLPEEDRVHLGLDGSKARWWLTVAICATTRCILAMRLSRNPGSNSALQTLDMIMQDKGVWSDAVGALTPWNMSGTPELVVTDCGSAFISYDTRLAAQNLGMRLEHAPAGLPQMRGRIERLFGTMSGNLMERLTGRTFGDIIDKGDHDPEARAALSAEDLCAALVRWVVDIYHRRPHEGLDGEAPIDCWNRLVQQYGVSPPVDLRRRRLVFGTRMNRAVDRTGITIFGVRYHSEILAHWSGHTRERRVNIRWYPEDIGAIAVELDGEWIEVPAVFERFNGVKAQTWLAAARLVRASSKRAAALHEDVIFRAIADIEALNGTAMRRMGLLVQDWSQERLEAEEERLFIGFAAGADEGQRVPITTGAWGEELRTAGGAGQTDATASEVFAKVVSAPRTTVTRHRRRPAAPSTEGKPDDDDDFFFGKK